jgi:hypothetical protein
VPSSEEDNAVLEATVFVHQAVINTHKLSGVDGFAEFFDADPEGAAGVVYFQGKWYDALITVDLSPYVDEDES